MEAMAESHLRRIRDTLGVFGLMRRGFSARLADADRSLRSAARKVSEHYPMLSPSEVIEDEGERRTYLALAELLDLPGKDTARSRP